MNLFENMGNVNRSEEVKPLIAKWSKTGLMEGLKGNNEKSTVAVLLENQAKQLLKEGTAEMAGNSGGGYEQWHGVALPLVRRVFAEIAAKEFVSVQPMNLPSGLVFYLDFKYGNSKKPFGFDPTGQNQTGTLAGITNTAGSDPSDGLYGAGRYGYSMNMTTTTPASIITGSVTTWGTLNYDGAYSSSFGNYRTVSVATGSSFDAYAVRGTRLFSGSTELTVLPAFTTVSGGNVQFIITGSAVSTSSFTAAISYSIQPTNDARSDFETVGVTSTQRDLSINNLNIPEIELQMRSIPVTAKTRKLKASWTPEFAQDLNAYHSVDAEGELTAMLSEYVSMEIDLEILEMLISAAGTTDYWSATTNTVWNG